MVTKSVLSIVLISVLISVSSTAFGPAVPGSNVAYADTYATFIPIGINQTLTNLTCGVGEALNFTYVLNSTMRIMIRIVPDSSLQIVFYAKWDGTAPTPDNYDYISQPPFGGSVSPRKTLPPNTYYFMVYCRNGSGSFNVSLTGYYTIHNLNTSLSYPTIQEAINANETLDGHTIFVDKGTYYEHVTVNKSLRIIGENKGMTVIDGYENGTVMHVSVGNVTIAHFTLKGSGQDEAGLRLYNSNNCTIREIIVENNSIGITLMRDSYNNSLTDNLIVNNWRGLDLGSLSGPWEWEEMNVFRRNNLTMNHYNFLTTPQDSYPRPWKHDIDPSNTINGKPIYYLVNQHNFEVPENAGYVAAIDSSGVVIKNLTLQNNGEGMVFFNTTDSLLSGNTFIDNTFGVFLYCSDNITMKNNNISGSVYNFGVRGYELSHFVHNIDTSNVVEQKPIYYIVNRNDYDIPKNAGYVAVVNSIGITLENMSLENNFEGVLFANVTNSLIRNVTTSSNYDGIVLSNCANMTIQGNIISENNIRGIGANCLQDSFICRNSITKSKRYCGIWLMNCSRNVIAENSVTSNFNGILFEPDSFNNTVRKNNIRNNTHTGIGLYAPFLYGMIVTENTITNNEIGINGGGWASIFYRNNIINNTEQAKVGPSSDSKWDNGAEGNYWSDYTGSDNNQDGIGDTPYIIDENNRDNYPLMAPYIPPAQMRVLYYELLEKYEELLSYYSLLNETCNNLLGNITDLQGKYDSLFTTINSMQEQIDSLNSTLQISINELQGQIDSVNSTLTSGQEAAINELVNIRNLMYIFMATTVILIATTVYLAIRKPKIKP